MKTIYYKDAWFKVEYDIHESHIDFKSWKITGLDDIIENSDVDKEACLIGFIKWDGCCEFDYGEHICGILSILMNEIYNFKNKIFGDR